MKDRHRLIARLFVLFFSVSVSVAVLPCGIINTHGLFGEITSSVVTDGEEESAIQESRIYEKQKQISGINIYNKWLEIWICIVVMAFIQYIYSLPRGETIVTLKVRMDN